jgi:hypothetical protein
MMSRAKVVLVLAAVSLVGTAADAARWGRPGLWAMTTRMQMGMGGMPAISAAQAAQMKKMGIKMPAMDGQAIETKTCVTPPDAENFGAHRYAAQDSGCTQQSVVRKGNHLIATVVCDGRMKGKGTSDVTLIDDANYSSVFTFKGVSHGRPVDMKVSATAHWLGADCGKVKPFVVPQRQR